MAVCKSELILRDQVLFHLLIYTGARKGELLALSWDDIDFEARTVRLFKTLFQDRGQFIIQTPKTRVSKRFISLDGNTLKLLKKWRIEQKNLNLAASGFIEGNNLVFSRDDGSPMRLAYPNEKLDILIKKHDLHRITIHGLRYTHASLFASIKEVQERLGHSDIQMTMNIYTHVTEYVKEQIAEKFQRYLDL
ncbi:site-specific integrase [Peribacillus glennii]|uniref:site-specific integrase n=1 Tax=Peribacillus glennii TaxID=2303991 RepID=UPI001F41BA31|nr:site-specific integrase [Peribacillus glennii]